MEKGTLIEFRLGVERRLATADRPEGKKHWIVVDERGQSHTLHPRQVTYEVAGCTLKPSEIPKFFSEEVEPYLDPSSLEVAWELLVDDGEAVTCPEMAQLLFSDKSPPLCYAAHWLLSEDKIYFKQKAEAYEPRSAVMVAEIKHQRLAEESRLREQQDFLTRVQQKLAAGTVEWQESDRTRIDTLERFCRHPENASRVAQEILAALGRPQTHESAFDLLVELGFWRYNEKFLLVSQIPVHFRREVLEVARNCLDSPPPDRDTNRLDLTRLKVYTIDDESTQEIDDGLSLEYLDDGRERLWIHIADPTRLVIPGDDLDMEARRRSTTLYLPTGMIPMFPPALATGPMSLIQGRICPALSFGVVLDEFGNVQEFSIDASLIKPTYRLTYEDVDEMLQLGVPSEPEIAAIATWALRREEWRRSQGAIGIHMPEAVIKVRNDDEITIDVLDDSHSRKLVAEMMILAGEVAGRYGQTHQIPLPFRGQPQPELPSDEELLQLPAGPVRFCAMRRCMPRSEMSITPIRHAGLGLETYTQVTSPIRRYSDLLAHFQIKAHRRGDSLLFSAEQLQEVMLSVTSAAYEATLVERQTNRYWGVEYLRRHPNEVWQVLVLRWLRENDNLGLILLEDLGLEMAMRFKRSVSLGDRLEVQVSHADPRQDVIQFKELADQVVQAAAT